MCPVLLCVNNVTEVLSQPAQPDPHSAEFPSLFPKTRELCLPNHMVHPGTSVRGDKSFLS